MRRDLRVIVQGINRVVHGMRKFHVPCITWFQHGADPQPRFSLTQSGINCSLPDKMSERTEIIPRISLFYFHAPTLQAAT